MSFVSVEEMAQENRLAILHWEEMEQRGAFILPYLDVIQKSFFKMEQERFAHEGPGWAELAQSTLDLKARMGVPSDILVREGHLRESLTTHSQFTKVSVVPAVALSEMTISADPIDQWGRGYASYHQSGSGPGGSFSPMRPPIIMSQMIARAWVDALVEWVVTGDLAAVQAIADVSDVGAFDF